MTAVDDATLARAAQAGDVASLGTLLQRHRALLHATAVGVLGHGAAAEDAVQDAFVIALRRIGELREPAAARGWLRTIVLNVALAQLRRPPAAPWEDEHAPATPDVVAEAVDRAALRDWVWTALEHLSEPLRLVVMLRFFSNASSYEAIADLCGVPVGTVRSRLSAAKARMATELLDTAAAPFDDHLEHVQLLRANGAAMEAFARTGDGSALTDVLAPDLRFRMADRVPRTGREAYAQIVAADMEAGVRGTPLRVVPGAELAIVELRLDSPPAQRSHCPPAVTQVHMHDGRRTKAIMSYYAPR
jgi:RNA polymerase sigma-70 factor (ECF subfamily)